MTSGVSLWRAAGMSYLQYVNKSANVLRSALKEPIKSKANAMSNVQFTGFQWKNGVRGDKCT